MKDEAVVICLGNVYMKDDGVGIRVAEALRQRGLGEGVSVQEYQEMDLSLIEGFHVASKIIFVDSVRGGRQPGTVSKYAFLRREGTLTELPSLHGLKLSDVVDLAMNAGILTCPVVIVGVEPKDDSVGFGLSPEVESALPEVIATVVKELSHPSAL